MILMKALLFALFVFAFNGSGDGYRRKDFMERCPLVRFLFPFEQLTLTAL